MRPLRGLQETEHGGPGGQEPHRLSLPAPPSATSWPWLRDWFPCAGAVLSLCAQAWKPGSQHAGEKRGVAGLLLGRTERAARAAELQLCAQAR